MKEPKDYHEAARERLDQARFLFDVSQDEAERTLGDKRYTLVVYAAGVAVEAMLRAYRLKVDDSFDGRHNIEAWFVASRLEHRFRDALEGQGVDEATVAAGITELLTAVTAVSDVWRNAHRYASERVLVKDLIDRKLIGKKQNKGDKAAVLRVQARTVLEAAAVVVQAGEQAWI